MSLKLRFLIILCLSLAGCQESALEWNEGQSSTNLPEVGANSPLGLQILFNKCSSCHGRSVGGSGGVSNILNPSHLVSSGLAIPSAPDTSPIMIAINNGSMPPTGPLTAQEITAVRQWIADGLPTNGTAPTPVPVPPLGPTFQSLYLNVFLPKCVSCHGPVLAEEGVRTDTFREVRRLVNVGNPADSELYKVVQSGDMPESPNPALSGNEISAILQWIQNGAMNN